MRRRDKSGRKAVKPQRRKTLTRRGASKAARSDNPLSTDQETNVAGLTRALFDAREQQIATAEILRVIRASPADAQPVFETIVRNAVSLCGGLFANVFSFDGELLHYVASHNVGPSYADIIRANYPWRPDSSQVSGRVVLAKSVVWLEDALADPDYDQRYPRAMGWRRLLGVPMLHEGNPIGAIVVGWAEPAPASKVQEELLKTFADQAVIAIENTRLLNATSEVLSTIASSAGELQPVFETMLAKATALCEASYGTMWLREGDAFRAGAIHGALPEAFLQLHRTRNLYRAGPGAPAYEAIINRQTCAVADLRETRGYREGSELPVAAADIGGIRTMVAVSMFKEDEPIGVISIYRREVRPFNDKQIELGVRPRFESCPSNFATHQFRIRK
jgi:hypothetical protein